MNSRLALYALVFTATVATSVASADPVGVRIRSANPAASSDWAMVQVQRAFRISDIRLNPGGFRACAQSLNAYSYELPPGYPPDPNFDDPTGGHRKCIVATVTVTNDLADDIPASTGGTVILSGYAEAWGYSVPGDYRSDRPPYAQTRNYYSWPYSSHQKSATFEAAVTYYDTALEQSASSSTSFSDTSEPAAIRDHLSSNGASVQFSLVNASAANVICHFQQGGGVNPDTLNCPSLGRNTVRGRMYEMNRQ